MSKRPTISDVARLSGVTPATVSRVLNAKRNFSASEEVRQRIFETARQIGYVPDLAARNLNRKQTRIIGVFAAPETHLAEGISESLLEGLAAVLHPAGYDVFFELTSTEKRSQALPFWRFDGAVVMQAPKPETVAELNRRRVPYVCVNESSSKAAANVLSNDRMGVEKALDHLAGLGHKRLAYANARASYLPHYSVAERYEALLEGAAARGMTLVPGHDRPFADADEFLRAAVIHGGATAVLSYDHHLAVMLVGAAANLGLDIPRDVSLVCFNDLFPVAILPRPLTAVAVAGREIGRRGAELLLQRLTAGNRASADDEATTVLVPEDLVIRASTAPPATQKGKSKPSRASASSR